MAKRDKKITYPEFVEDTYKSGVEELKQAIEKGCVPAYPTRFFKVGDEVKHGNHENIKVVEVLFGGLGYYIHFDYMGQAYGKPERSTGYRVAAWTAVFPMSAYCKGEVLKVQDDVDIRFYNSEMRSLINLVYFESAGVEFDPPYQRELVWTMEQKLSLIDSIFNNIDIGKFTFIVRAYTDQRALRYEILDGKQRLKTLCEFYEDRFAWRGKKFTELSFQDAHHFTGFPIIRGEVGDVTEQQILKLFIKLNTCGTPVAKEHLQKVQSLIK